MASGYPPYDPPRHRHSLSSSNDHGLGHPYPPTPYNDPNSASTLTVIAKADSSDIDVARNINRTPSPTPSEARELKTGAIDWKSLMNWRFWFRKEWAWYYVAIFIIVVITALVSIFHKQIVHWLRPAAVWLHDLPFGWLVPVAVLFVISFPPLFGHEIVAILCGLVWGLWIGFGIVAAGTFFGEVGNFYAFKYCCRARGEKLERTKISYACLAKVVRDGGFKIALVARLSAIPGHFTTAVFSTCGMGIFTFSLAAILSLPKQFITVYLGVILDQSETGESTTKSKIISDVVLGITILITVAAMWYILRQMNKVKPEIIYAKRKARQAKLARANLPFANSGDLPYTNSDAMLSEATVTTYNVGLSETDSGIPLKSKPSIYTPQPHRIHPSPYTSHYDEEDGIDNPESYNYIQPQRHRSRTGRGRDVLSVVREDSEEVGWDMGARYANENASTSTVYTALPPPPGIVDSEAARAYPGAAATPHGTSSNNPYLTVTQPTGTNPAHQNMSDANNNSRPRSTGSHIITFDPDAVTVSSAPHTPDLTLPTPPYPQHPNDTPLQSAAAQPPPFTTNPNPRLSPFRDPPQSLSMASASRSTPNLFATTTEVFNPYGEATTQQQSRSLRNTPEMGGQTPAFVRGSDDARVRSDAPPEYELQPYGGLHHGAEPSDATFHTAWGSSHSRDESGLR